MKNIVLQQREERDFLLAREYQIRNVNIPIEDYLNIKTIKVITGPRRAGKSVFALQILKNTNFAYLNFDDKQLLKYFDEDIVFQTLMEVYPNHEYLLLDEVQNLEGWEMWVSKLYRRGINLVITGSNAKLLSSELATSLSGRFLLIEILPFSVKETCSFLKIDTDMSTPLKKGALLSAVDEYMHYGGYAEIIKARSLTQTYLQGVYDTVLLKDIIQRYKIHNTNDLYNIADWFITNYTNPFTISSLTDELDVASKNTLTKYCGYLENSYMFFYLSRFDNKLRIMKKAARKVYIVDNGFILAKAFRLSVNLGRLLENMVFVDLIRRGYEIDTTLFYYRSRNDKEVDFALRENTHIEKLIQVCYDISSAKTLKREVSALIECAEELHCTNLTIITWDSQMSITESDMSINVMPYYLWSMQ